MLNRTLPLPGRTGSRAIVVNRNADTRRWFPVQVSVPVSVPTPETSGPSTSRSWPSASAEPEPHDLPESAASVQRARGRLHGLHGLQHPRFAPFGGNTVPANFAPRDVNRVRSVAREFGSMPCYSDGRQNGKAFQPSSLFELKPPIQYAQMLNGVDAQANSQRCAVLGGVGLPVTNGTSSSSHSSHFGVKRSAGSTRGKVFPSASAVKYCGFCKRNGELPNQYTSHNLQMQQADGNTIVGCPVLRNLKCEICGATEDNAHTRSHCPHGRHSSVAVLLEGSRRRCDGKVRKTYYK